MRRLLLVLLALIALLPAEGGAQRRAPLEISTPRRGSLEAGTLSMAPMLNDRETRELLSAGFPARIHLRAELWREGGWFDDLENSAEWDLIVQFDPMQSRYRVLRREGARLEFVGGFASLAEASAVLERPTRLPLIPSRPGRRYYYNLVVDVEMLSLSDLDQLERWLNGELRPAVRGDANPVGAVGRGVRTLFLRVIGGTQRRYERRSASFRA